MNAIILGATGAIGGELLQMALEERVYDQVVVIGRESVRRLPVHPKMLIRVVDMANPVVDSELLEGADIFCAIGTGNRADFERVDYGMTVAFAQLCEGKVRSFNLVSAMGANAKASYDYLRVKGRIEDTIRGMSLGVIRFYRPSMLIAPERQNLTMSEHVWIRIFQVISPLLVGRMKGWKGIRPRQVAKAMLSNAVKQNSSEIYHYQEMMAEND